MPGPSNGAAEAKPGSAEPSATVLRVEEVEVRRSPRAGRWRLEVPWGEPARTHRTQEVAGSPG